MKHGKLGLLVLLAIIGIVSGTIYAQDNTAHTVGILLTNELALQPAFDGFVEAMTEIGYRTDETIYYVYFEAFPQDMDDDTLAEMGALLASATVDVFLVATDLDAQLLSAYIEGNTPIIVCFSENLVGIGLAESLTNPGGNVTGISTADYHARGLQLLLEIDPAIKKVFFPYNSERPESLAILASLQELAEVQEFELAAAEFTDAEDVIPMIQAIPEDIDGIYLPPERAIIQPETFLLWLQTSVRLKAALAIPAAIPVPGVLMGYGPDSFALGKQAAGMVDRILRGADPAETPVEIAEYFLMVNLQTADALDLEIPRSVLRQAQTIIRPGDLDDIDFQGGETKEGE